MTDRAIGILIATGGLAWLVGVLVLEVAYERTDASFPAAFALLAIYAGLSVGWGFLAAARSLDTELGRVALRLVGASAAALGLGFGFDLFSDDMFLVFLLAYTVGVFLMPVAFLVLGLGIRTSQVFPRWAKWIPLSVPGFALLALAFQVLAPELWDPSDAVWFLAIGVAWVLMGLAIAGFNPGREGPTPGTLGNR